MVLYVPKMPQKKEDNDLREDLEEFIHQIKNPAEAQKLRAHEADLLILTEQEITHPELIGNEVVRECVEQYRGQYLEFLREKSSKEEIKKKLEQEFFPLMEYFYHAQELYNESHDDDIKKRALQSMIDTVIDMDAPEEELKRIFAKKMISSFHEIEKIPNTYIAKIDPPTRGILAVLRKVGDVAIDDIIPLLQSNLENNPAYNYLSELREPAILPLGRAFLDDGNVRAAAVLISMLKKDRSFIEPFVLKILKRGLSNSNIKVKEKSVDILKEIDDPEITSLFIETFRDEVNEIRQGRAKKPHLIFNLLSYFAKNGNIRAIVPILEFGNIQLQNYDFKYSCLKILEKMTGLNEEKTLRLLEENISEKQKIEMDSLLIKIEERYKQSGIVLIHWLFDRYTISEILNLEQSGELWKTVDIILHINQSPSRDIRNLQDQIIPLILENENPLKVLRKIENIFVRNNLPLVGKIFRIFELLYPLERQRFGQNSSPVLQHQSTRGRRFTFYRDLLNIHLQSGNRSLRRYLTVLQEGEVLLQRYEQGQEAGMPTLSQEDANQLSCFLRKLETLQENTIRGETKPASGRQDEIDQKVQSLRQNLEVKEGQLITERISELFLKPVGVHSISEALELMDSIKERAEQRNQTSVDHAKVRNGKRYLHAHKGDLAKGINDLYFRNILNNGSVAKEFLGSETSSDATPFDTDVELLSDESEDRAAMSEIAQGYGDLLLVMRPSGQWERTHNKDYIKPARGKFELFQARVAGGRHYAIRTGFPLTEVDFIIAQKNICKDERRLRSKYFEIARNGYYIPVVDESGKVIFTPGMYEWYRDIFDGLDNFEGNNFDVHTLKRNDSLMSQVQNHQPKSREFEQIATIRNTISSIVETAMTKVGLTRRSRHEEGLLGVDMADIGSTARGTNLPGGFDFDFVCKLNDRDWEKVQELQNEIVAQMRPKKQDNYQKDTHQQLRMFGVDINGQKMDIDIGFARKSEQDVFEAHDAVAQKLQWIRGHLGDDVEANVIANIRFAKDFLKKNGVYKKGTQGQGGLGGIGIETWILNHHGNVQEAFYSFRKSAYEGSQRIPFETFRDKYLIIGAGENIQKKSREDLVENFCYNMTPEGYDRMLEVIEKVI